MGARRFAYLCGLLGCLVFYIAYQEWFSWILLLCVAGLPWLSLLLSLPGILTFRISAGCPAAVSVGVEADAVLMGSSRFPVPPFKGRIRLRRCTTGEQWRHTKGTALPTNHCGGIVVSPEKVRVCDYLGLFRIPVRKIEDRTVIVRPEPMEMEVPPDLSRYLARSWRPKPGGGYAENHELRLYRPGDNLNQVHWKLTAKAGKMIIREPMEPERGLVLLTMDLKGSAAELDKKFGKLLWLSALLLEQNVKHEIRALTGAGLEAWTIAGEGDLRKCIDQLLCREPAGAGSIRDQSFPASWQYYIGGDSDEA